jgi:hypothetical protein
MIQATYSNWKQSVNRQIDELSGLSCDDLADACYREMYDDETIPRDAALAALEGSDYPTELVF